VEGRERDGRKRGESTRLGYLSRGARVPSYATVATPPNTVADRFLTDLTTVTETVEFFCLRVNRGHSGHPAAQPICLQLPLRDACVEGK